MTEEQFENLWQRAEVEGYATKLSQEYPAWRTRQRRTAGMTAVAAVMLAVAVPVFVPHHDGYGKVYCNRSGIADAHWADVASNILTTSTL